MVEAGFIWRKPLIALIEVSQFRCRSYGRGTGRGAYKCANAPNTFRLVAFSACWGMAGSYGAISYSVRIRARGVQKGKSWVRMVLARPLTGFSFRLSSLEGRKSLCRLASGSSRGVRYSWPPTDPNILPSVIGIGPPMPARSSQSPFCCVPWGGSLRNSVPPLKVFSRS